jgi:hypothetical protein
MAGSMAAISSQAEIHRERVLVCARVEAQVTMACSVS